MLERLYCSRTIQRYSVLASRAATCGPSAPRFNSVLTACHSNRSASSMAVHAMYMASLSVHFGLIAIFILADRQNYMIDAIIEYFIAMKMINISRCVRRFLPIYLMGLPLSVGAEAMLQYRNISMGDASDKVLQLAANEFAHFKLHPRKNSFDTLTIMAGDNQGIINNSCSFAATSNLQKNCISARFIFSSKVQGDLLDSIFVEQGFSPAINRDVLIGTLVAKYGKPRLTSGDVVPASYMNPESKFISLLWGGLRTPVGTYQPSGFPYEDREIIGGKYISVVIHYQGNFANGYSLRIVDSETVNESMKVNMIELKRLEAERRTKNEASAKF